MSNNRFDTRQSINRAALGMIGSAAGDSLDTILTKIDAEAAKLFEDRNIMLADGGLISFNSVGTSLTFGQALKLHINSQVAGGSPTVIDLASTTRTLSANLRMLYAVINRSAGTATVTDDSATLPAQTSANQEVVLIAKRIDSADGTKQVYFRNGFSLTAGQSARLTDVGGLYDVSADNTSGSLVTLAVPLTSVVRLTNASLVSVAGITAGFNGQMLRLENATGTTVSINDNDSGATAANRIYTGNVGTVTMLNQSCFIFTYDSTASRWVLTGGSGSGSGSGFKNILSTQNSKFEGGVSDWVTYDDGASASPTDGTGGSPSAITISGTTSGAEILEGLQSLKIAKSAADGQGEGTSVLSKTIDRADMGKPFFVYFSYDATHANYVYGDMQVFAYDVTNAQLLTVYNDSENGKLLQQKGLFSGVIYPQSTCAQVRLILHVASTSALAYDVFVDEVVITPQASIVGPVVTDWVDAGATNITAVTTAPTKGSATITTDKVRWRRVGGNMEVNMEYVQTAAGTATAGSGDYLFAIPNGYTIDTSKVTVKGGASLGAGPIASANSVGTAMFTSGTINTLFGSAYVYDSSRIRISGAATQNAGGNAITGTASSASTPLTTASVTFAISISVPIVGWSAGASLTANDAGLQTVVASATVSTAQSIPNNTLTTFINWTESLDNYSAFNPATGKFTAPKSGNYRVAAQVDFATSGTGYRWIGLYKNTSTDLAGVQSDANASFPVHVMTEWTGFLSVGETIEMRVIQTSGGALNAGTTTGRALISISSIPDFNVFGVQGPIVVSAQSDWTAYTPTSLNLGTLSAVNCWYKRIGDGIMIRGEFTVGTTVAASPPGFTLPSGYNLDTTKIAGDQLDYLGTVIISNPTLTNLPDTARGPWPLTYDSASGTGYLCIADDVDSDLGVFAFNTASGLLSSGNKVTFFTSILPIAGLSSETRLYPTQRVIGTTYLKDVKTSGTHAGTFTSGAYQTRTLNTQEGDTGFCSLSSNQFTLQPGTYEIEAMAPAFTVDSHKAKIRNTSDSTDAILGLSDNSNSTAGVYSPSILKGRITISSAKTFELQHRCLTTRATDGFGRAVTFGDSEIYAVVKIDKIY